MTVTLILSLCIHFRQSLIQNRLIKKSILSMPRDELQGDLLQLVDEDEIKLYNNYATNFQFGRIWLKCDEFNAWIVVHIVWPMTNVNVYWRDQLWHVGMLLFVGQTCSPERQIRTENEMTVETHIHDQFTFLSIWTLSIVKATMHIYLFCLLKKSIRTLLFAHYYYDQWRPLLKWILPSL